MGSNPTSYIGYGFKSHQLQSICGTFCYFSGTFGCDTGMKLPDYIKPMTVFQTGNSVLLPEGPAGGWAGPRPEDAKDAAMAALGREHGFLSPFIYYCSHTRNLPILFGCWRRPSFPENMLFDGVNLAWCKSLGYVLDAGKLIEKRLNPRPVGGGAKSAPPTTFSILAQKRWRYAPPNFAHPSGHHFRTLWSKKLTEVLIGRPSVTSE